MPPRSPRPRVAPLIFASILAGCASTPGEVTPALESRASRGRSYLSGTDRNSAVPWEFFCTANRKSGVWTTIKVPSCWDVEGFGNLSYGDESTKVPVEQGKYRHRFAVPAAWKGQRVEMVFDGVMTDADVSINGKSAGPVHQGAFYQFKYDVTDLVSIGGADNLLEVTVSKRSANESINRAERKADYWVFGGIFRPVYLEHVPQEHVERVAIDARADGSFGIDVFMRGTKADDDVEVTILDARGNEVAVVNAKVVADPQEPTHLSATVSGPAQWTAETPNLYTARATVKSGGAAVDAYTKRFGFRTVEVRAGDGIYVNGQRVMLKGVCRHAAWPDSGRTLSPTIDRNDIRLIKEMNMNAVRMSHYPPDESFLELCDEMGLYVIDELAGWQKSYDQPSGARLVGELIVRDVNHPSILFWDNGNEGGWNEAVDGEFAKWDPQRRHVLHPWGLHGDIDTKHYPNFALLKERLAGPNIFMPTEFLHGLFDGGAGAGLRDYWDAMRASEVGAGGFIWVFADEGVRRADDGGRMDVAGNAAPDGVVGPYREKEGSFFTVKKIWSPVVLPTTLPADFDGTLQVENAYDFTSLTSVKFEWKLLRWPTALSTRGEPDVVARGSAVAPDVAPHGVGTLAIVKPTDLRHADADALALAATDDHGNEIASWVWPLRPARLPSPSVADEAHPDSSPVLRSGDAVMTLDPKTNAIVSLTSDGRTFPLTGGPRLVLGTPVTRPTRASTRATMPTTSPASGPTTTGRILAAHWSAGRDGWFKLDCEYDANGPCDYLGIGFDFPERGVKSATWLGSGPYRVWQNRLEGPTLGLWTTAANDTDTGWSAWKYPEFKGYFGDLHWTRIDADAGTLTIAPETPGLYLQRFRPNLPPDGLAANAQAAFPDADLSLLNAIPAIGTKFTTATVGGPQGQPFHAQGRYRTVVWFRVEPK